MEDFTRAIVSVDGACADGACTDGACTDGACGTGWDTAAWGTWGVACGCPLLGFPWELSFFIARSWCLISYGVHLCSSFALRIYS